ncbi:Dephospho-CoA kinase [hydrothermal vent metagenome]|uniref:Dephospho-CoA kinase n=1 Tax=hydrothermal vent metagenome TaxID=652676 RepID=A0A1W1DWI7_9ZZZZ
MKSLKIALTGGIACGKSQFADFLGALEVTVIRLDELSKEVTASNSDGLNELVNVFSKKILNQDGELNQKALRTILLDSKADKIRIEAILHPKILEKMQELMEKSQKKVIVVEIPLLFEKKLEYLFDRVVVVTCNNENQLKRLRNRVNIDESSAKQMISIQISQKNRLKSAKQMKNDIIKNDDSIANLKQQAEKFYTKLINL